MLTLVGLYTENPRTLGKYRLIAEIARGGMGIVYLAMAQGPAGFSKLLVVKELNPELGEEPAFLKMFLDEARLAARLNHPNIVQTNEVGVDGMRHHMAMDFLDGHGFERVRRRARNTNNGQFSVAMQLRIISDVLSGLEYAHTFEDYDGTVLGIVHRDISPQNVFVTYDGQVKLLDFGIAKTIDSANETRAGVLKGKLTYMAPEQARGERVDARADLFGVGVMLWEAIAGRSLHQGQSEQQILSDLVARVELPRLSTVWPNVPAALDAICARALAAERDDRYHSAAALQADIDQFLATQASVGGKEIGAVMREMFRDDRTRASAMIEKYVARARSGEQADDDDDLPIIDVSHAPVDARTPIADVGAARPASPSTPPLSVSTSAHGSASGSAVGRSPSRSGVKSNGSLASGQRMVGTLDAPATPAPTQAQPARGSRWLLWVSATLASVAAGAVLYNVVLKRDHGGDATSSQPAGAQLATTPTPAAAADASTAPAAPAGPKLLEVEVRAQPDDAQVQIDGASVQGNPFHGKYVWDGAMHQVKVSAPGYVAKTEAIAFDGPVTLDVHLDKVPEIHTYAPRPHAPAIAPHAAAITPPAAGSAAAIMAPPPAQPTATDVNPNGGNRPHRQIDPNNPYGN